MKDLGILKYILGIEVCNEFFISLEFRALSPIKELIISFYSKSHCHPSVIPLVNLSPDREKAEVRKISEIFKITPKFPHVRETIQIRS